MTQIPRVLSIAGTDPTGGAGIHADLKSIAANGGYGMAAVTVLVAQNTRGVRATHAPPASFLTSQLDAVSDDVTIDAVKIGMLGDTAIIDAVADWLTRVPPPIVVLDPVMIATSDDRLLDETAEGSLRALVPRVDLVTPNLPELAILLDEPVARDWAHALDQGERLAQDTGTRVLVKGGHLAGMACPDALVGAGEAPFVLDGIRINTPHTHGTGCSMSAALATRLAVHGDWRRALTETKAWLTDSIQSAAELRVGAGHGPINHFHALWSAAQAPQITHTTHVSHAMQTNEGSRS
ncbi:hydroxymethylpyrimidine/phosphomethylpyrimidine kinase/hydroxymethylpyrimidine kinase/phosphomethylpyrimidine kinase/thiamine-phosphate diphosphorylase [Leucobacter exalbidus]|uniref:Hydroxymethylpyrimidine/phosphomethylpyrimidine kinase/hydroxymethylpyrimidine kinase/phosphomethylpyrimidine kinase/thiamine-phosphate diphosphorylase n=1 Tax=Leucobacter exalbidus TaxID=662960 RepID=A0A940PQR4_9MICO|nr:bifunctional hydroxymethylpyrimidine kinase/phosphomethylpyrimidine kinase [Leucobacter exalbidus]MBP1325018.1 hydroxymethylpyrimidine/phosphomethylpyrimidine kinase/hydroxymethylpyrimidine kinase/phosphomethylpyrimidine kinase/thiamine-phosphate diphosphorylase [Leucobacter exalbidus]